MQGPWVTIRTVDNDEQYGAVNQEPKDGRQVLINQLKVLELGDVPATTVEEKLSGWVAPWSGEPSSSPLQEAPQASGANAPWLQALNLGEQLSGTEYNGAEPRRQAAPHLPAQAVGPTRSLNPLVRC